MDATEIISVVFAQPLFVEPLPLADLVAGGVVAPPQAFEGTQIDVRYTVINLGAGATLTDTGLDDWTDTIWLTRDKTRPHPGKGDVLLASVSHHGTLGVGQGYDQRMIVTLPGTVTSGTYYITSWTDSYRLVLEDTLAVNVNPDDPHEIDYYYKARAINIIGRAGGGGDKGHPSFGSDVTTQRQNGAEAPPVRERIKE